MDEAATILYGDLGRHGSQAEVPDWKRYPVQFNCRTLNTMTRWFQGHRSDSGVWTGGQHWAVNLDYCLVDGLPQEWRTWSNSNQEIGASDAPTGSIRRLIHFGETPEKHHIRDCWISGPDQAETASARGMSPRVNVSCQETDGVEHFTNCALAPLRAIEQLTAADPTWRLLNNAIMLAYHQQTLIGVVIGDRG